MPRSEGDQTKKPEPSQPLLEPASAVPNQRPDCSGRCFFKDGVRQIDYVLVWEDPLPAPEAASNERLASAAEGWLAYAKYREKFHRNLLKCGVQLEKETTVTPKMKIHFVKLHVTWETMCHYAEYMRLRAPLKVLTGTPETGCAACLCRINLMQNQVPNRPKQYYTCLFKASRMQSFLGIENKDTYFTSTQRHLVAQKILSTRVYGNEKQYEIGIERLIEIGAYDSAFPLHEGTCEWTDDFESAGPEASSDPNEKIALSPRQVLRAYWANWSVWYKYQPLDHVREYFGEKIAFYFAWLGTYTGWLLLSAGFGVFILLINYFFFLPRNVPTKETCNSGTSLKMCPICDEKDGCEFWHLSDICVKMMLTSLLDQPLTAVLAFFASVWAVLFLAFWKRRSAELAHRWGVTNFRSESSRPRPTYVIGCNTVKADPITGEMEPYFPQWKRIPRMAVSYLVLILMMAIVMLSIIMTIILQTSVNKYFLGILPKFRFGARLIASGASAVLVLVVLLILEVIYEMLAYRLTEWEMHPTQWKFEDQLISKLFIFDIWNYYASIFYTAFIKGRFSGYPGNYFTPLGFRLEECDEGGCLFDLAVNLAIVMVGRQIIVTIVDQLIPEFRRRMHQRRKGLEYPSDSGGRFKPWEEDYRLLEHDGLRVPYREMVVQFGFVTIFVAAFPLAPLFAAIRNCVKIRTDAKALLTGHRRPLELPAQGIAVWYRLLQILTTGAVIMNAFLIAFTSDLIPRFMYQFEFHQNHLGGYLNYSLAWSPPNTTSQPCRYRNYRDKTGRYTPFYWRLLMAQLSFVIIFEVITRSSSCAPYCTCTLGYSLVPTFIARASAGSPTPLAPQTVVLAVRYLVIALVPRVPKSVRTEIKRQNYLGRQALIDVIAQYHGRSRPNSLGPQSGLAQLHERLDSRRLQSALEKQEFQQHRLFSSQVSESDNAPLEE